MHSRLRIAGIKSAIRFCLAHRFVPETLCEGEAAQLPGPFARNEDGARAQVTVENAMRTLQILKRLVQLQVRGQRKFVKCNAKTTITERV